MNVTLYKTSDDNNVLDKTLEPVKTISTVNLKNDCDIYTPTLLLDKININTIKDCNYLYIPDFGRYYFITNIGLLRGGLVEITCRCDVLMSFKESIKELTVTVARNENISNGYIIDDNYRAVSYSNIVTKEFPNGMTDDCFILMTVG